jgi:hypothetical protein
MSPERDRIPTPRASLSLSTPIQTPKTSISLSNPSIFSPISPMPSLSPAPVINPILSTSKDWLKIYDENMAKRRAQQHEHEQKNNEEVYTPHKFKTPMPEEQKQEVRLSDREIHNMHVENEQNAVHEHYDELLNGPTPEQLDAYQQHLTNHENQINEIDAIKYHGSQNADINAFFNHPAIYPWVLTGKLPKERLNEYETELKYSYNHLRSIPAHAALRPVLTEVDIANIEKLPFGIHRQDILNETEPYQAQGLPNMFTPRRSARQPKFIYGSNYKNIGK